MTLDFAPSGTRLDSHEVTNQATVLTDYNAFDSDPALSAALEREGGGWAKARASKLGAVVGSQELQHQAYLANKFVPELMTHDRFGHRLDEVEYHPAYHYLMSQAFGAGVAGLAWSSEKPGGHLARAVLSFLWNQGENGVGCPTGMAYAAVPALRQSPRLRDSWAKKLTVKSYDPELRPEVEKASLTIGMTLTEKQAGSDLRGSTTRARQAGAKDEYLLTGHKWFCSAPMSDGFFVIAYTDAGPTLFVVPRVLPDGKRNRFYIQMLKDKCGNRSNASSSIELCDTFAWRISEEGKGIRTAMEDAHLTRLDFAVGSAGLMRQALSQAIHYGRGRRAFQKPIASQPLMQNVLADLALESEAAMTLVLRIARAIDEAEQGSETAKQLQRIGPPLVKFFVCKTASGFTAEALECMGGNGYIENHMLARLYREAPLNCIWEGSSNMVCLDVLRALEQNPSLMDVMMAELRKAQGADPSLDAMIDSFTADLAGLGNAPYHARWLAERLVRMWQAALLLQHTPSYVADAFVSTRLDGNRGFHYGAMGGQYDTGAILERAAPPELFPARV